MDSSKNAIKNYLHKWNSEKDNLAKVQSGYVVLAIGLLFVSAFVALVNQNLGQSMLFFSLLAILTFVANGILWAVLKAFVVDSLDKDKAGQPKAAKSNKKSSAKK